MLFRHFLILLSYLITGCAGQPHLIRANSSAFLGEYGFEKAGENDNTLFSYWKKQVSWRSYKAIIVDPVLIETDQESQLNRMPHAERAQLREFLEFRFREALVKNFRLENRAGENTLHLRLKLIDADAAGELAKSYSAIHPPAPALTGLNNLLAGLDIQGYKANIAVELIDSTTGDLLMAAANAVDGGEPWGGLFFDEADISKLSRSWVDQLSFQLCRRQGRGDCDIPK